MSLRRLTVGSVSLLVASPALVACTGTADDAAAPPAPPGVSSPIPSTRKAVGVQKDVKLNRCELKGGTAAAGGTLVNSSGKKADFAITVSWMPAGGSTEPISVASTTVPVVESKATATWSLTTNLPDQADHCVIEARRGALA